MWNQVSRSLFSVKLNPVTCPHRNHRDMPVLLCKAEGTALADGWILDSGPFEVPGVYIHQCFEDGVSSPVPIQFLSSSFSIIAPCLTHHPSQG